MTLTEQLRDLPATTPHDWLDQALDVALTHPTGEAEAAWRNVVLGDSGNEARRQREVERAALAMQRHARGPLDGEEQ